MSRIMCSECGSDMVKRRGPIGRYYGCSRYPDCMRTHEMDSMSDIDENDPRLPIIRRKNRAYHELVQVTCAVARIRSKRGAPVPKIFQSALMRKRLAYESALSDLFKMC